MMQGKQTWSDCSGLPSMRHVRFKGGGQTQTTTRNIPAQTAQEAALQTGLFNYGTTGLNNATNYQNQANSALGKVINLDWNKAFGGYTDTMNGVNSGYGNLLSGNLPTAYSDARKATLTNDLTGTFGNAINNLASRGIINSSSQDTAFDSIGKKAADSLNASYSTDMNNYANILGNTANNAANQLNTSAQAQQNSYYTPNQLFNYANNSLGAGQNLFNTLYNGRMGTGGSTTTQSGGGNSGAWSALGSIGSAAIMCFVAGTKIATPDGYKNIEDIKIGDKVYSLNGSVESVIELQEPFISPNDYMLIKTKTAQIRPTSTQPFMTTEGYLLPHQLQGKKLVGIDKTEEVISVQGGQPKELVYDFKCTGANVYFADGFAVKGRD
jgi:hypothetical protein